ncbi:unnamed protein product, partial [Prorocentrum cordatum]
RAGAGRGGGGRHEAYRHGLRGRAADGGRGQLLRLPPRLLLLWPRLGPGRGQSGRRPPRLRQASAQAVLEAGQVGPAGAEHDGEGAHRVCEAAGVLSDNVQISLLLVACVVVQGFPDCVTTRSLHFFYVVLCMYPVCSAIAGLDV